MRFGSVSSGIGAPELAWGKLGWTPVFFSEIAPFPCRVLKHYYPQVPNFGDMTKFKEWPDASIDLLVGGTPCQSFSVAGLRKGLDDPRGNLALTFLAIADRFRPQWLVWENVPGVHSSWSDVEKGPPAPGFIRDLEDARRVALEAGLNEVAGIDPQAFEEVDQSSDFDCFLAGMVELGYGVATRVLDAQHFGVPQRRRRVFVIGHLGDWRPAAAALFERESLSGNPPPRRKAGQGVAGTLENRAKGGGGFGTDFDLGGGAVPCKEPPWTSERQPQARQRHLRRGDALSERGGPHKARGKRQ